MSDPFIVCEKGLASAETRALVQHCMMQASVISIIRLTEQELSKRLKPEPKPLLVSGSVQYMRKAFECLGVSEPQNISYPQRLGSFLNRPLEKRQKSSLNLEQSQATPFFVKPVQTKAFTGFVFRGLKADYSEHDQEQLAAFLKYQSELWISPVRRFQSEWRYYVCKGQIAGLGRYDPDGLDDAPQPDLAVVKEAIKAFVDSPVAYSLDFGVDEQGTTTLIEANDAWALGLYSKAMTASAYFELLKARFDQILTQGQCAQSPQIG